jgi:hypothetical protein
MPPLGSSSANVIHGVTTANRQTAGDPSVWQARRSHDRLWVLTIAHKEIPMKRALSLGTLLGSMMSLAVAQAQEPAAGAPPAPPKPAPELVEYMKDLLGTWTCTTTFAPGAFGPGSPEVKATSKVKMSKEGALGGFFYKGEYSVPKSKTVPMAFNGIFYLGYDPGSKQILNVSMDNTGAAYLGAGPLSGNVATWTGEGYMMGAKAKVRETMTKTDAKNVTHKFEVDMGKGFAPMGEDVCKK